VARVWRRRAEPARNPNLRSSADLRLGVATVENLLHARSRRKQLERRARILLFVISGVFSRT
jgi:hypothetical protein